MVAVQGLRGHQDYTQRAEEALQTAVKRKEVKGKEERKDIPI